MTKDKSTRKVAYLLGVFPLLSETFILNEILELKRQGINVIIFSMGKPKDSIIHPEAAELARETHYVNERSKLKKVLDLLFAHGYFFLKNPVHYLRVLWFACGIDKQAFSVFLRAFYVSLVLKRSKVESIHTHFASSTAEYAMLISKIIKIPYSLTPHAADIFKKPRLIKEKVNFAEFVISKTEYNKGFLKEKYPEIDEDKIRVVHYGVDLERFAPSECNVSGKQLFTIVSVARLVEKKGHRYLLEACNFLVRRGRSDFICKIIGDGPLRRELEELAYRFGLSDNVQFMGAFSSDKVLRTIKESDLFVLPCIVAKDGDKDGMPNVLIEAMAVEKPVVSTYVSGIPELIKDGSGILVPPEDSEALAQAIEEIYYLSPEERKNRGRKGREIVVKEFDLKKNVSEIKNLFLSVAQKR